MTECTVTVSASDQHNLKAPQRWRPLSDISSLRSERGPTESARVGQSGPVACQLDDRVIVDVGQPVGPERSSV